LPLTYTGIHSTPDFLTETQKMSKSLFRIDKDVERCDRNLTYFLSIPNLDKLRNIITTYVWENLDIGYMQVIFLVKVKNEITA